MNKKVLNYINKLESYKTGIKGLHWSSKNMSEHKLCDEIADMLSSNQDEIAEISQGIFGKKFELGSLKPKKYKVESTKKLLDDLLKDTKAFYSLIKGRQFVGLRSVVESFIGEINKNQYLVKFVMKEDLKRRITSKLNENVEEECLRSLIKESIKNVLVSEGANDCNNDSHFAIYKPFGKIVYGWDYSDYDPEELKQFKNDYFTVDIKEFFPNQSPRDFVIWTRRTCIAKGLDPANDDSWMNVESPITENVDEYYVGSGLSDSEYFDEEMPHAYEDACKYSEMVRKPVYDNDGKLIYPKRQMNCKKL